MVCISGLRSGDMLYGDSRIVTDGHIVIVSLTQGKTALVDDIDFAKVSMFNWTASKSAHSWYAVRQQTIDGKRTRVYMHRFLTDCPPDKEVHHKNGDTLDNRRCNMECVTKRENLAKRKYFT